MIDKIFNGPYLRRLDNIIQWQEKDVFARESVSQHSFKVAVFTSVILEDIFPTKNSHNVVDEIRSKHIAEFKLKCIQSALFHDLDEALLLRDISHETKYNGYNGEQIRNALNALSDHIANREFFNEKCGSGGSMIYYAMRCKNPVVKSVVKVADWMALIFFVRREQDLGNKTLDSLRPYLIESFKRAINEMKEQIAKEFEEFDYETAPFEELYNL